MEFYFSKFIIISKALFYTICKKYIFFIGLNGFILELFSLFKYCNVEKNKNNFFTFRVYQFFR